MWRNEAYARPFHPYTIFVNNPPTQPASSTQDETSHKKARLLTIVRMSFLVLSLTVVLLNIIRTDEPGDAWLVEQWWIPLLAAVFLAGSFLAADILTPHKKISTLTGMMLGLMSGLILAVAMGFVIDLIAESWSLNQGNTHIIGTVKILLGIALCYLGITTVIQTQDDFRLVIPYVEFAKQMRGVRPLLLDTSAIIDARIVEVVQTNISQAPIIIPQFVLAELQRLADSADKLKRARGRRGLDIVAKLQRLPLVDVTIDERPMPYKAVDHMLVDLARQLPAIIVTTDTGLSQVAAIHSVQVLNINDLANALKPNVIPGEQLLVKLIRRGEQHTQAVGYLPDGTMVVAEDGCDHIGTQVMVTVTSSLQTAAGKMIFSRIHPDISDTSSADTPPADSPPPPLPDTPQRAPAQATQPPPPPPRPETPPTPPQSSSSSNGEAANKGPFPPKKPAKPNRARNPRR